MGSLRCSLCHIHVGCVGCAVMCCAVLCCAVLCCDVMCCAVLCCAVLCCAVCAVLCCADCGLWIVVSGISEHKSDLEDKLQTYNKTNGAIRRHFGKQMNKVTKLRTNNITAKAALRFGSEAWVLRKREEQRLEAAQMKFLRQLLGITKLDKEKNQCIRDKTGAQNVVKEIKQYKEK